MKNIVLVHGGFADGAGWEGADGGIRKGTRSDELRNGCILESDGICLAAIVCRGVSVVFGLFRR